MLHAIKQKKTKFYRRYHGEKLEIDEELRVSQEDEITSTFFGPLDFMSNEDAWRFWQMLLETTEITDALTEIPQNLKLTLWPRRIISPDSLLTIEWSNGKRLILMIEIKWGSPLSGDCQLHNQWLNFLTEEERQNAYHVFIAPNICSGVVARSKDDKPVWGTNNHRLILLSWVEVRLILGKLQYSFEDSAAKRWSECADDFLEKIGVYRFNGFSVLNKIRLDGTLTVNETIFWNPIKGFSHLQPLAIDTTTIQLPLFFKQEYNNYESNHGKYI